MRFDDFIEATNAASSRDAVFDIYLSALAEYGCDRVMYSALTEHPLYGAPTQPSILRNYPEDWIGYYVDKGYIQTDPVRNHGLRSRFPFTWRQMMTTSSLTRREKLIMSQAREAGLKDGIGIAFHGPFGEVTGVGLASAIGGTEPERHLAHIHALSVQFHTAISTLTQGNAPYNHRVELTRREREVLSWCASGKTNWAIGEIMGISEHGVDFHLRNIMTKLDADSRITAVVKGLRLGLITI